MNPKQTVSLVVLLSTIILQVAPAAIWPANGTETCSTAERLPSQQVVDCYLRTSELVQQAIIADPTAATEIIQEIRQAYDKLRSLGPDANTQTRSPDSRLFLGAQVLVPIYRADPEAALDLLQRIREAAGQKPK